MALSEALKTNTTLTNLDLWGNSIGDNGAQSLAEALKNNSTLTTLDLWRNSIGDNGALALAELLERNSSLTTLSLGYNSIGPKGAQELYQLETLVHINNALRSPDLESLGIFWESLRNVQELQLHWIDLIKIVDLFRPAQGANFPALKRVCWNIVYGSTLDESGTVPKAMPESELARDGVPVVRLFGRGVSVHYGSGTGIPSTAGGP
ncbi:hypothetical protein BGZ82_009786 [Podila clonocystis]|nr:hypothetical protein BGZ82_009786 [Podila clonocystis]